MSSIRATMSNVTVAFGLVSFPVDLMPATASKRAKARTASTVLVCPTCNDAGEIRPLKQRYLCEHDHGPFGKADAAVAISIDGVLQPAPVDDVAEVMQPDTERGVIELTVHPAEQVEGCTFPSGNIYRLRPRGNEAHYGLVLNLVHDRTKAFVCEVMNKDATLLYRLVERDGMLLLTELVRPERITDPFPLPDVSFDWRLLATGESLVESMCEPFFPDDWADRRKAKLVALAAKLEEQEAPTSTDHSAEGTADEILELMRRSLDAA